MSKIQWQWLFLAGMVAIMPLAADEAAPATSQIQTLQKELDSYRTQQLNIEMEAQQSMRTNWDQFTQDVNASEDVEKHILELQERIDQLKKSTAQPPSTPQGS